jgi:putative glutamine amidotransferase
MKKIAITQRLVENELYSETRDALDIRWAVFFAEIGALPVILPSSYDFRRYFKEIGISGIVFTGGNDLYTVSGTPLSLQRDTFEKSLLQFAIEDRLPVLGICRGMQLIAEHFGATLQRVEGHAARNHELVTTTGCKYFAWSGSRELVNSYHAYVVATLPECFRVAASTADGDIEAIEHNSLDIMAQMWHPEREMPFKSVDIALFKRFFDL